MTLGGSANASYAYDAVNRLTQLNDSASLAVTYAYDVTNKLTSRNLPNGVATTYEYDGPDRLTPEIRKFTAGGAKSGEGRTPRGVLVHRRTSDGEAAK